MPRSRSFLTPIAGLGLLVPWPGLLQRYQEGSPGIAPHLDLKGYRILLTPVTAEGAATVTLRGDHDADPAATWYARQGSMVLLREPAPGTAAPSRCQQPGTGAVHLDRV